VSEDDPAGAQDHDDVTGAALFRRVFGLPDPARDEPAAPDVRQPKAREEQPPRRQVARQSSIRRS
jgi:hypothetical protein